MTDTTALRHDMPDLRPDLGLGRVNFLGLTGFILLVVILGGWAATTVIGGAVVASGQMIVPDKPQVVQSLDGGMVAEIHVRNSDVVEAGALLVRLDSTLLEVNLDIARNRLAAALARQARLRAEQLGLAAPVFEDPGLPFALPDMTGPTAREAAIFASRVATLGGQRAQLAETLDQLVNQRKGMEGQIAAAREQADLLDRDLESQRALSAKGLTRQSQVSQVQQARAQLAGTLSGLEAELSRLGTLGRDATLQLQQAERAFQEQVVTELREVTTQVEELTLEIVTHAAQLARVEIRAPTAGIVHEMQVSTRGGVVAPGAVMLQVIPLDGEMAFELRVDPRSIDQVHRGQSAELVLSSFDPQATPPLKAVVGSISAGKVIDPQTRQEFYRVGLEVPPAELERAGDIVLIPGMPVEGYLHTSDRTVLSYLLHPIVSHLRRTFRE